MEGVLIKFLHHLDLNKDGKPDWEQVEAAGEKVLPALKKFAENGGVAALVAVLSPVLSPKALEALKELEAFYAAATKA
jgi:hypothetical protein